MSFKARKLMCLSIAILMMLSLFAGCGSAKDEKTASVSTSTDEKKAGETKKTEETKKSEETKPQDIKLRMWAHSPQFEDSAKAVAKAFMDKNPNIKIELEVKTPDQYFNLLGTAIQAGDAPDIFWANGNKTPDLGNLVKIGGVMDLTGKVDLSAFDKMAQAICSIDGKIYQTPYATIGTRAVYFNKDIFEKNGLQVPSNFSELEKLCDTLLSKGITPISFGAKLSWSILFLVEPIISGVCPDWIDEAAAGKAKINDPRLVNAFKKYEEWAKKGYFGKNFLGVDEGAMLLNFSKGNTAMCITGSWNADTFAKNNPDLKLGAFQMPMANGGKAMVVTYTTAFCGYSKTKYPNEVLKFLQFIVTPEAQQIYTTVQGEVPGMKGLKAKNELIQSIGTADKQVESLYNIIGFWPKEGMNPRKLWEEDSLKWVGGKLSTEQFIKEIDDSIDYSKVK